MEYQGKVTSAMIDAAIRRIDNLPASQGADLVPHPSPARDKAIALCMLAGAMPIDDGLGAWQWEYQNKKGGFRSCKERVAIDFCLSWGLKFED